MEVKEPIAGQAAATDTLGDKTIPSGQDVQGQALQALQDVAFGSIAGIVGKYVEYPFDLVKVRLQSQPSTGTPLYNGPLDCFRQSIRRDGFLSLYRGVSAPLFGAAIETSCLFFSYRLAQDALRSTVYNSSGPLPMTGLCIAGAVSGAFTSIFLTPIELIKCKMQVQPGAGSTNIKRPGPLALIASVFRHDGVLGFWRGQLGTLIRETGGSVFWFGSFEGVSLYCRNARAVKSPHIDRDAPLPLYQQLAAGASAGMSYNFFFFPADTIKSRMQTEDIGRMTGQSKPTFWTVGKHLWRDQGLRGMYSGCGITVARAAPSSALIFTVYQMLLEKFASR